MWRCIVWWSGMIEAAEALYRIGCGIGYESRDLLLVIEIRRVKARGRGEDLSKFPRVTDDCARVIANSEQGILKEEEK